MALAGLVSSTSASERSCQYSLNCVIEFSRFARCDHFRVRGKAFNFYRICKDNNYLTLIHKWHQMFIVQNGSEILK